MEFREGKKGECTHYCCQKKKTENRSTTPKIPAKKKTKFSPYSQKEKGEEEKMMRPREGNKEEKQ